MVYGSEGWRLNLGVRKMLNGANAQMVGIITGKTPHQEASQKWQTFDIVRWLRARRLKWVGDILRTMGTDRMLKQAIFEMHMSPQDGDLLMDAPEHSSIAELIEKAKDRDGWRKLVNDLKPPKRKRRQDTGMTRNPPNAKRKTASTEWSS